MESRDIDVKQADPMDQANRLHICSRWRACCRLQSWVEEQDTGITTIWSFLVSCLHQSARLCGMLCG